MMKNFKFEDKRSTRGRNESEIDQPLDGRIPQSIGEIFEISNKNRKRNKLKKKKEGPTAEAKKATSRNNSNGSNKGVVSSGAFINYNEVTEIIRHQYKIDGKENGLSDFKAVCNH